MSRLPGHIWLIASHHQMIAPHPSRGRWIGFQAKISSSSLPAIISLINQAIFIRRSREGLLPRSTMTYRVGIKAQTCLLNLIASVRQLSQLGRARKWGTFPSRAKPSKPQTPSHRKRGMLTNHRQITLNRRLSTNHFHLNRHQSHHD